MSHRRHENDLIYVERNASPNHFGVIAPEPSWFDRTSEQNPRTTVEPNYCVEDCGDPDCREWISVMMLKGQNRRQAMENLLAGRYHETLFHVPECRMDDGAWPF